MTWSKATGKIALLAAWAFFATAAHATADAWMLQQGLHLYPYAAGDPAKLTPHVLIYLPRGYEQQKKPLMILLHGGSGGGDDPQKLRGNAVLKYIEGRADFPFITASPQAATAANGAFDAAAVNALVDDLVKRLPVDPSRVYLAGTSLGGRAAWKIAADSRHRFAALVPVASARPDPALACALKDTPVWAFHNEKDDVQALQPVREMVDAVLACQGTAKLTAYPKSGHNAWTDAYSDPSLYEWLASQRR